ncbi:tetratricopeptide repeat protein [Pontibacter vulgaris]|uniref:tetratricopeptide repeat protein n=1 Tax=Pontibacter vulgaris TaxID=2905679 RepID=UPI001FA6B587|nr:DUF3808 domain-containing protein [Pontibacter vulgaris]
MAKPHPFFLLLCICLFNLPTFALSSFNSNIARAYSESIKLKTATGRTLIQKELQSDSRNAVAILVANYPDFLTLCVQQNPHDYNELLKAQEKRLQQLSDLKEASPWVGYGIAEIRAQLAISKLIFGHRLAAAWDFRLAYLQYEANAKLYPGFLPNKKSLGLMQALIGSVPDSYKWFLNIMGMQGSLATGLANLRSATSKENPFYKEALVLHALLQQQLDQQQGYTTLAVIQKLAKDEPDNLLYTFVTAYVNKKLKKSNEALYSLQNRPTGSYYLAFPYLYHMAAELYLCRGNTERSVQENKIFLSKHKGQHYLKSAHFKLYLAFWLDNNFKQAEFHLAQVKALGKAVVEEDVYAERFADENLPLNRHLLLARLYSDGGYGREALKELNRLEITKATPQALQGEYFYRKARIYHDLNEVMLAKRFYNQTISTDLNSGLYFAPNAALQLGYIYQSENDPVKAKVYFRKAISYKGHAYKNSIDQKAKLALSAL